MLTSMVFWNAVTSVSRIGPKYGFAAPLFTRMSMRPWAWSISAQMFLICSSSPMWHARTSALPPAARISWATRSQSSGLRLDTITSAPWAASAFAIDSPMPREAPVTSAILPDRSNIFSDAVMSWAFCGSAFRPTSSSVGDGFRRRLLEVREVVEVGEADASGLVEQARHRAVHQRGVEVGGAGIGRRRAEGRRRLRQRGDARSRGPAMAREAAGGDARKRVAAAAQPVAK